MLGISVPGGSDVVMPRPFSCQPRFDSAASGYRMFCVRDTQAPGLSGALAGVSDMPWWGWALTAAGALGIGYGAFRYVRAARRR